MKALILAGGFATRLRPLSCTRPKILFPVCNKPLLQWTFERLAKINVTDVILAVSQRTEVLFKQQRFPKSGFRISYSRDPPNTPLGTGGAIKKAEKLLSHEEAFLVLNEDIFADLDYADILEAHRKAEDAVATIALHSEKDPSRYGVAELAKDNYITRFVEKPKHGTTSSDLVNAGVYVLTPKIFHYIPEGKPVSFERKVFPKLAEEGVFHGYVFTSLWMDMGKPEDYLQLNRKMLDQHPIQKEYKFAKGTKIRKPVAIDKAVSIGQKSTIGPYVAVGKDVTIGKGVQIRNSIIFPSTTIGELSLIRGAIIGEAVAVGPRVEISQGCMIGDGADIKEGVRLARNVAIGPGVNVAQNVLESSNIC